MSDILEDAEWDILEAKTFSCQLGIGDFEKRNVMVSVQQLPFEPDCMEFVIDPDATSNGKVSFTYDPAHGCYFDPVRLVLVIPLKVEKVACSLELIKFCKDDPDERTPETRLEYEDWKKLRILFDSDCVNVEFLPLFMRALGWKGEPMSHEMAYKAFPNDVRKPFSPLLMKSEDQSNMRKFYQEGTFTDFVLVSSDNREVKVHRVKLAAVSEVFLNMLSHETVEKRDGICRIADIDYGTLKLMVDAFYGLPVDKERMKEYCWKLDTAANKYQILELQSSCLQYMDENMAMADVVEVFKVGKERGDECLVKSAVRFVRSNYEAFIDMDGFSEVWEKIPDYSKEFFKLVSVDLRKKKRTASQAGF